MPDRRVRRISLLAAALSLCLPIGAQKATGNLGWPTYGGDPGGQRYSAAAQITRENVAKLQPVWEYHTHALESGMLSVSRSDFEATPILFRDTLYLTTPFDRIIALDPATGIERWTYDPGLAKDLLAGNYTSRGVAAWADSKAKHGAPCGSRIFLATLDARLLSVDAQNGRPCEEFGVAGQVELKTGLPTRNDKPYLFFGNTSPPTVVGDVVVVGSAVGDNQAVETEPGVVRGFDAHTGRLLWSWDPMPWAEQQHPRTSAANAWGVLAADPEHHLVFVPTTAPSPDFYGGYRPGDDRDANSIVALNADTGKKVWAYQLIHHDVWDYDVASEPLLFEFHGIPAVAITPKTGVVFVFNRLTGEPIYPITERPVPQDGAPGEHLSPTQPFSSLPPLNPLRIDTSQMPGH
ncbi:MAG TPA: PQQ-binding-like beta-propeller repeat protein, partial [Bryobacteraceae bacterium]|nr:PQQ-binding-like beta-propeller repeat protein [Bryobacteraceae bacterium]